MREVLADAAAAGEHLGDRAVRRSSRRRGTRAARARRRPRAGRRRSARRVRVGVHELAGELGRGVVEHDVGARPEELGAQRRRRRRPRAARPATARRPARPSRGPASGSSSAACVTTSLVASIVEVLVQVGHAEVVDRVAVVVAEGDHRRRRLDREVEVEQRLRRARHGLQPDLVEALEHRARRRRSVVRWRMRYLTPSPPARSAAGARRTPPRRARRCGSTAAAGRRGSACRPLSTMSSKRW